MIHVNGLDVSGWQGSIDFAKVKAAGYSFVYTKATEGDDFVDTTYTLNRESARAAGLLVGAYHFMDWDNGGTAQGEWFLAHATPESGDLIPMLDCEGETNLTPQACVEKMAAFLAVVQGKLNRFPAIYLSPSFWADALGSTDDFTGHPLWLAQYDAKMEPSLGAWKPTFWQYRSDGDVDGIKGDADLDYFLGDLATLESYRLT